MNFRNLINKKTSYLGSLILEKVQEVNSSDSVCDDTTIFESNYFVDHNINKNYFYYIKQLRPGKPIYLVRDLKSSPVQADSIVNEWYCMTNGLPVSGAQIIEVVKIFLQISANNPLYNQQLVTAIKDFHSTFINTDTPMKAERMYFLNEYRADKYTISSFNLQVEVEETPEFADMINSGVSYTGKAIKEAFDKYTSKSERLNYANITFQRVYLANDDTAISEDVYYFIRRIGDELVVERDLKKPLSYVNSEREYTRLIMGRFSARGLEIKETMLAYRNYLFKYTENCPLKLIDFIDEYIDCDLPIKDKVFYELQSNVWDNLIARRDLDWSPRRETVS